MTSNDLPGCGRREFLLDWGRRVLLLVLAALTSHLGLRRGEINARTAVSVCGECELLSHCRMAGRETAGSTRCAAARRSPEYGVAQVHRSGSG